MNTSLPGRWHSPLHPALALFLLLLPFLAPASACGQSMESFIEAVTTEFPPFVYTEHHQVKGVVTEIATGILARSHQRINIRVLPWSRAYQTAQSQPNTLLFPLSKAPARENDFFWIGPIITGRASLFALKKRSDLHHLSFAQAKELKTGTIRNNVKTLFLKEKGFTRIEETATPEANAKKLLLGWIDLWAEEERTVAYLLARLGYKPEDVVERVLPLGIESTGYLGFNKNSDPKLVQAVRQAFEEFKNSPEYLQILNKYQFSH